ncbi:hypothetical protein C1646_748954 [Rhizophagus diaphanus]|nr:hypothetical protein C1646_748954 [Rhizophagus diaphanus] [Rhizophagus sp. MUCL 43196]
MVNAVPYQLLKRGKEIYMSFEGAMLDYEITPNITEITVMYTDQNYNLIGDIYIKVLGFYYAKAAPFSIDVSDVPTPQLPSAYAIKVIIADEIINDQNIAAVIGLPLCGSSPISSKVNILSTSFLSTSDK